MDWGCVWLIVLFVVFAPIAIDIILSAIGLMLFIIMSVVAMLLGFFYAMKTKIKP